MKVKCSDCYSNNVRMVCYYTDECEGPSIFFQCSECYSVFTKKFTGVVRPMRYYSDKLTKLL